LLSYWGPGGTRMRGARLETTMPKPTDFLTIDDLAMLKLAVEHIDAPLIRNHPAYDTSVRRFKAVYHAAEAMQEAEKASHADKRHERRLRFGLVRI
jgi:hypothetical protein